MRDDILADAGQVLWIGFAGPQVDDRLRERLAAGIGGAVVLFHRNLVHRADGACDLDALVALIAELRGAAREPLLVAVDQEGGTVQRVRAPATRWPPMLRHDRVAAPDDAELAAAVGAAVGAELAALGFDIDFAPVLDVHTSDANPVIGERAFGRDAAAVIRRGLAFARGLTAAGILPCGKHFPGHGDTVTDSHLELPRIAHGPGRLDEVELAPFAAAAEAELPMIMTAHVVFDAIDPTVPATLSPAAITGVLRDRFHYRGVIVSDDLDMKAIVDHVGVADAAVRAVAAGCDALLLCKDEPHQQQALDALCQRAADDQPFRARLAEAARRVRGLHRIPRLPRPGREVIGAAAHQALAARLAGS
jgi:beta-N-acetylhexosaminidase